MARWFVSFWVVMMALAVAAPAAAQTTTCATPSDCDADGTNNFDDVCPAVSGNTARGAATGFVDIGCYLPFVPPLSSCIPVAARPFDDFVPDDALHPVAGSTHRKGFTYVGIYDIASGGPAAAAPYLTQADAARAGGGPRPLFAPNTMFACFGSVEFNPDGTAKPPGPTIYGFRVASAYARSVNTAAVQAQDLGLGTSFKDALGLVESARIPGAPSETPGERPGIVGTAGTWDNTSLWSTDAWVIVEPLPGNVPKVERLFYTPACIDPKIPRVPKTPFGFEPMVPSIVPQSSPAYLDKFMADEFKTPGTVNVVDLSGCGANPESEAYVFYSHSVINLPSISIFGISIGGGQIDLWWIDEPRVWVRAVEQFAGGLPLRTFAPPEFKLREPRPNWGPPYSTVSAGGAVLFNTGTLSWGFAGGAAYSALQALGLDGRPLSALSQADVNSTRSISATLHSWQMLSETYDQTNDSWRVRAQYWEGQPNQVNANVPLSANPDTEHYSFAAGATDGHLNAHFWADKWHPAGDYWEANGQGRCGTLSQRFTRTLVANPAVDVASEWCPNIPSGARRYIDSYAERVNLCDVNHYNANDPESHWPIIGTRVPFATLYGHLHDPDAPSGRFPASDFVHSGLKNMRRLHEGLDFNWEMKEAYADPSTRAVFGAYDATYCFGKFVLTEDLQLPISCNDRAIELCGSLAGPADGDGCNPAELAKRRWEESISDACKCKTKRCGNPFFDFLCTVGNCIANTAAVCLPGVGLAQLNYLHDVLVPYITAACVAWNGSQSCNDPTQSIGLGPYILHRDVPFKPGQRKMEDEIEYNVAFGVRDIGLGRQTDCAGGFGIASTCDWNLDNSTYEHKNWVYTDDDDTLVAVGTTQFTDPFSFTTVPGLPNSIWPVVFGGGMFQTGSGVWGKMATVADHKSSYLDYSSIPSIPILSPDVAALRVNEPSIEHPFRLELLGDLIVDCGHNPLRPEIHPPAGAYMHLGGPGRYSLFAWQRPITPDLGRDIVVDLWPAKPRPHAGAHLKATVIDDRGILIDTAERGGKWVCSAYPLNAPDRYRCTMFAEGRPLEVPGDFLRCIDNLRMLPSCHDGVAGGIVEVSWE